MKQTLIILIAIGVYSLSYSQNALYGVVNSPSGPNPNCMCDICIKYKPKPDTIASHLLISHKPPSFGHSIEGYCIVVNDVCTGRHLVWRRRRFVEIKPPYDVWRCVRKEVGHD